MTPSPVRPRFLKDRTRRPTANEGGVRVPIERPDTASLVRQRLLANADDVDALFVLAALRVQDGYLEEGLTILDRKSTRLNSSHVSISYAVFCLKKKTQNNIILTT